MGIKRKNRGTDRKISSKTGIEGNRDRKTEMPGVKRETDKEGGRKGERKSAGWQGEGGGGGGGY